MTLVIKRETTTMLEKENLPTAELSKERETAVMLAIKRVTAETPMKKGVSTVSLNEEVTASVELRLERMMTVATQ